MHITHDNPMNGASSDARKAAIDQLNDALGGCGALFRAHPLHSHAIEMRNDDTLIHHLGNMMGQVDILSNGELVLTLHVDMTKQALFAGKTIMGGGDPQHPDHIAFQQSGHGGSSHIG